MSAAAAAAAALVVTRRHSLSAAGIDKLYRTLFDRLPTDFCDVNPDAAAGLDDDWRDALIDYASLVYADSRLSAHPENGGRPDLDIRVLAHFMKPTKTKFSLAALCGMQPAGDGQPSQGDRRPSRPIKWVYVDGCAAPPAMVDEANELGLDLECLRVCAESSPLRSPIEGGGGGGGGLKKRPSMSELLPPPVVQRAISFEGNPIASANGVVIGGAFDRLHNGHKMLITTAALIATKQFTCGVTDGPAMLASKVLWELIDPVETRIKNVREFVSDIEPNLNLKIVPITDMYGPSVKDNNIDVIVATCETAAGADKVNAKRRENGLPYLRPYIIGLADDCGRRTTSEDFKVSSWKSRREMLGTLQKPVKIRAAFGPGRYVIGLTGGICSGKTHIADDLRQMGARVIDCDKLGHEAYAAGTKCFENVVDRFGQGIVDPKTGEIDRQKLAATAYASQNGMADLSAIVWPEIWKAVSETIKSAPEDERVWVLDAAVLLEAGWHRLCEEVWVSIVPPDEAVRRLKERNGLTDAQAAARLAAQTDNRSRVAAAHVVFTSVWPRDETKMQVKRAWGELHRRLSESDPTHTKL